MEPDDFRVTIRLSARLYGQLEAHGCHGQPLAAIVREALEAFLAQPRQPPADMAAMAASLAALQIQVAQLTSQLAALAANRQPPAASHEATAVERLPMAATPATPKPSTALPAHIQRIAETAMAYDKLSLAELSQLLYTRNIYRTTDRTTGEGKPVNRGTLLKWLEQARQAGVL